MTPPAITDVELRQALQRALWSVINDDGTLADTVPATQFFANRDYKFVDAILAALPPAQPMYDGCAEGMRERAAKFAESMAAPTGVPQIDYDQACHDIAAAIRELPIAAATESGDG